MIASNDMYFCLLFQGFRGKLLILEKRRLDLDAARRDYNRLEQKRVKKSESNQEPPAELIIQIQAKETALNGVRPPADWRLLGRRLEPNYLLELLLDMEQN